MYSRLFVFPSLCVPVSVRPRLFVSSLGLGVEFYLGLGLEARIDTGTQLVS